MSKVHVQFSDEKQTSVIAYFAGPQDISIYPNQGEIESTDNRYLSFYNAQLQSEQQSMPSPD